MQWKIQYITINVFFYQLIYSTQKNLIFLTSSFLQPSFLLSLRNLIRMELYAGGDNNNEMQNHRVSLTSRLKVNFTHET